MRRLGKISVICPLSHQPEGLSSIRTQVTRREGGVGRPLACSITVAAGPQPIAKCSGIRNKPQEEQTKCTTWPVRASLGASFCWSNHS